MKQFDLKAFRKSRNLSQTEFGAKIGYTFSAISGIETGRNAMTIEMMQKISDVFGVNFEDYDNEPNIVNDAPTPYNASKNDDTFFMKNVLQMLQDCQAENKELYKQIFALKDEIAAAKQSAHKPNFKQSKS